MLPNFMVGLFLGVGVAGWVYSKTMRQTGNNTQNSLIVAGVAGLFAFLVVLVVLSALFH